MSNFLMSPARHAAAIRASFPGEDMPKLCARVGHDIGAGPSEDVPHLLEVMKALRTGNANVAPTEQAA